MIRERRSSPRSLAVVVLGGVLPLASCASQPPTETARTQSADPSSLREPAESCTCTLSNDELAERETWLATFAPGIEGVSELSDGFEVRFKGTHDWSKRVFELVEKERSCCSSLVFELKLEPESGPILLRVVEDVEADESRVEVFVSHGCRYPPSLS